MEELLQSTGSYSEHRALACSPPPDVNTLRNLIHRTRDISGVGFYCQKVPSSRVPAFHSNQTFSRHKLDKSVNGRTIHLGVRVIVNVDLHSRNRAGIGGSRDNMDRALYQSIGRRCADSDRRIRRAQRA